MNQKKRFEKDCSATYSSLQQEKKNRISQIRQGRERKRERKNKVGFGK
jgi:hypothetical protein